MPRKSGRWLLTIAVCAAAYVGASQIGFDLAYVDGAVSTVWVPTGLAIVMVVLGGRRLWPAILIGEFLANVIHGSSASTSVGMGVGDVLEALAGQALLARAGFRPALDRVRDVFSLLILAGLTATLVGAVFGTASLMLFGGLQWSGVWSTWYTWWLGDATGVIVIAPLLFAFSATKLQLLWRVEALGVVAFLTVLAPMVVIALGAPPEIGFLTLPALVWGTLRFRQLGATVANAVIACALVILAHRASAPLHGLSLSNRLLLIQDFAAVSAMTTLVLAVAITERERDANALEALGVVSTATVQDTPIPELLTLTARTAGELLRVEEILVVTPAGVEDSLVLDGWSATEPQPLAGAQAPGGGLRVPVTVHGVEWGELLVPDGGVTARSQPADHVAKYLAGFARQVSMGIASAQARDGLIERATTDPLTGVANHRRFHERLSEEAARAARHSRPLTVAMIDIDDFKLINDSVGHVAGDEVLATVAHRLLEVIREEATVGRLGGDEFGVVLPECDTADACAVLERALGVVASKPIGAAGVVRISAGVCDNTQATGAQQLREFADAALYWGKAHGRSRVVAYQADVSDGLSGRERAVRVGRPVTRATPAVSSTSASRT